MRVFILYTYGEYGPEDVQATLDTGRLLTMIDTRLRDGPYRHLIPEALGRAAKEVCAAEPELDGCTLVDSGWGSLTLMVIKLDNG